MHIRFNLNVMISAKDGRNHAARFSFPYQHPSSEEDFACILEYIHIRKELITPAEFSILLRTHEACRITAYVEACRQYFPYDWDRFDDVILSELSFGFSQLSARQMSNTQLEDWASLFTDIVAGNQDLVTNTEHLQFRATIYFILWYAFDPDDAWYRVCRWVDMLELAKVDITRYLKLAIKSFYDYWVETKARGFRKFEDSAVRRKLFLGHYKGRKIPYWIEYADNSCPIRELLTEFPALRYMDKDIRRTFWYERTNVSKEWNSGRNLDASHVSMMYWPVIPPLNRYSSLDGDRNNRKYLADWADRACELQECRFERREHRRLQKLNGKRNGRQRIPGAWVD